MYRYIELFISIYIENLVHCSLQYKRGIKSNFVFMFEWKFKEATRKVENFN